MSPQKRYASCGIQTDYYDFSSVNQSLSPCESNTPQFPVGHSCVVAGSDLPSSESDITLANGSLVFESAYNQSPDSQDNGSPSLLSSRYCFDRFTGIIYGRPSENRLSAKKRVVSLTSISPTGQFKTTMLGDKLRLVSMPERGKYASILARDSSQEKRCIDDLGGTSDLEQMERVYPTDLPQTPSPPSSPESITIIGNNTHVPGSFLRRPGYTDNDGWISWANSPPRPIPALHGPLSLPYARCPSGAEGTLVEGDDLSHKIWGLGIDDSQTVHFPATNKPFVCQAPPPQDYRSSQVLSTSASGRDDFTLSHYCERDAVIDISRPATFYGHVGTQRVFRDIKHIVPALPIPTNQQTRIPRLNDIEGFATLRAKNPNFQEAYEVKQSSILAVGLGLHTWSSRGSTVEDVGPMYKIPSNPLNTAAAVFVPASANVKAYPSKQRHVPPSEKFLSYAVPSASRRPSVYNNTAAQHRQLDAQNFMPTPPSTSSPCWTPIFSHQPEMAISKTISLNSKVFKPDFYSPKIYSPIPDLEDDSNHIRAIMQKNAVYETDITYESKVVQPTSGFPSDPFTFQAYLPKSDSISSDNVSSSLKATSSSLHPSMAFSTNHENTLYNGNLMQAEQLQSGVGIQGSTERRRNLSYQQPRSIPLARLIQRRLSSVAEEDQSTKILIPFSEEAQKGGFTCSKGVSLESLDAQMSRTGLLDEEIFTTEVFTVRDHQLAYEAESMLNLADPNVVVKLPQKTSVLRRDIDSNREKELLRHNRQATHRTHCQPRPKNKVQDKNSNNSQQPL